MEAPLRNRADGITLNRSKNFERPPLPNLSRTLDTSTCGNDAPRNGVKLIEQNYRVRKLTERECFKLMGVKQEDFEKLRKNQSKSSCYHLAGDSIVTTVLMAIFGQMFDINWKAKINEMVEEIIK